MIRTGILGGTFDPIHKAHTSIAMLAKEALALDEIWLLPDGDPPHKRIQAGGEDRLRMAELAARGYPGFRAIDIEVRRQGTTYTVDTLRQLRAESPERMFVYIIGGDTLDKLPFWHEAEALPALCEIAVIAREERGRAANCSLEEELRAQAEDLMARYGFCIHVIPGGNSAVSSSDIRRRVARGLPTKSMLAPSVARYIEEKGLYRDARIDRLREKLTPQRYRHTLGVEEAARRLARRYGADEDKAAEAALFHDCAKCAYTREEMLEICEKGGIELVDNEREITSILHAPAGAALARSEYGVTDPEVLDAIRWHTTGHAGMTLLAKVVFLADAIEPYRKPYPGIEKIRRLARKGLDEAVCQSARETQKHVAARSLPLNPNTAAMLAELDHKKGEGTK